MKLELADDIQVKVEKIVNVLDMKHIDVSRIKCLRSFNSKANAYARIYAFPRVWTFALGIEPHYIIEVLSEKFDILPEQEQEMTILHEIMHIPKTFSGALNSHTCKHFDGKGGHKTVKINRSTVKKLYKEYKQKLYKH